MGKAILRVCLVVILLIPLICLGCGDTKNEEVIIKDPVVRQQNRYYPYRAITEFGKNLSISYCAQASPNDPIVTVVLLKAGKEYYYDLRK